MVPLKREISILSQCDSPHIVRYFGSYTREHDLWITMEYCNAGSASDLMEAAGITSDSLPDRALQVMHSPGSALQPPSLLICHSIPLTALAAQRLRPLLSMLAC